MELLSAFVGVPEVNRVYHVDALTLLRAMPAGSVSLIAVDPPYNGVKDEAWDNQWATDADFLEWLRAHLIEFRRVLKPNGSLYLFASPRMAARVEVLTGEYFNVLNNISWWKTTGNRNWSMDKDTARQFLPNTESVIFAEQINAQAFMRECRLNAGVSSNDAAKLFPSVTGGETGCVRNWELGLNTPSFEQYRTLQTLYPLPPYQDAIRFFSMNPDDNFADVWFFDPIQSYPGKHPCEKPAAMMQHIINASSRAGDLVLDCFCGSGQTLAAAYQLGRDYIGCDIGLNWVEVARNRCVKDFGARRRNAVTVLDDLPLFAARPALDAAG